MGIHCCNILLSIWEWLYYDLMQRPGYTETAYIHVGHMFTRSVRRNDLGIEDISTKLSQDCRRTTGLSETVDGLDCTQ